MKVMILAAGKGTRMQPLTQETPKPLLKVNGRSLLAHHLTALAKANFQEVVINISHLGHLIQKEIGDGSQFGLKIHYSCEEEPLETGGGIYKALSLLGDEPFLVVNGDIWTNYPWHAINQQKIMGDDLAHLVLVSNPEHHLKGDYHLKEQRISYAGDDKLTYSGIAIYSPKLFANVTEKAFSIIVLLRKAIEQNLVSGEHYRGNWFDVGTPERFAALNQYLTIISQQEATAL